MLNPECIEFNPERHEYRHKDHGVLPGVTSILDELGLLDGIPDKTLEYAAERGKAVHEACCLHSQDDLDYESLDPAIAPYVNAWIRFRDDTGFSPEILESIVFHEHRLYCGTLDCIGKYPDGLSELIDIKTTSSPSPDSWGMQVAAYAEALPLNMHGTRKAVVHLRADGTYRHYPLNERFHWMRFTTVLNFYNLKREITI